MVFANFDLAFSFVSSNSYLLILLAMIIEGPIVTTAAAFASSLGVFNVWIIFILALIGDLIGDFLHYSIGYFSRRNFIEKYEGRLISKKRIKRIENSLQEHLGKTLCLIKFTPFLATPGLLLAGALKVPPKKFILYSLIIALPKTLFFIGLGFYFGLAIDTSLKHFNLSQYILLFLVAVVVGVYFLYKKLSKVISSRKNKIRI